MRTVTFLAIMLFLSLGVYSQGTQENRCSPPGFPSASLVKMSDQISDFTITDSDGNTWNLYQQLDEGKTVFLDLFFST